MRFMLSALLYCILLLPFASSCSKNNQDCGCNGSTRRILENVQAQYTGEGVFVVPDINSGFIQVYPCEVDTTWEISKDENTWNYTISGDLKKHCFGPNPELELPYPGGKIRLTNIQKR
jgi:ABC-type oligopeptide transport system substrate-binding subunit